jgi:hypothetical protein
MWLTTDEVLLNYSVIKTERDTFLLSEHCTSSYCASPLYEVAPSYKLLFSGYVLDKEKGQRAIILQILKMELWLLYTALPLIACDHCMILYLIPTTSFQVILWTNLKQSNKGQ